MFAGTISAGLHLKPILTEAKHVTCCGDDSLVGFYCPGGSALYHRTLPIWGPLAMATTEIVPFCRHPKVLPEMSKVCKWPLRLVLACTNIGPHVDGHQEELACVLEMLQCGLCKLMHSVVVVRQVVGYGNHWLRHDIPTMTTFVVDNCGVDSCLLVVPMGALDLILINAGEVLCKVKHHYSNTIVGGRLLALQESGMLKSSSKQMLAQKCELSLELAHKVSCSTSLGSQHFPFDLMLEERQWGKGVGKEWQQFKYCVSKNLLC